jgi:hypothetical protein
MRWTRTLCGAVLLGLATLPGCSGVPDAGAQAQATRPAPGGMTVHLNAAVVGEAAVSH